MQYSLTPKSPERPYKGESLLCAPEEYVVIDLETTGLNPKNDSIIEFGAVHVVRDTVVDTFSRLVNPNRRINYFITQLTGITNEMLSSEEDISLILPEFLEFVGDRIVMGHNVNFDVNFVYENCHRVISKPFRNDFIDTMRLSRRLFPEHKHHKLSDLIERFCVGESVEHRALGDAMQTNECFIYMKRYMQENDISFESLEAP